MTRRPLPDDPGDLRLLLGQVMKFLGHAEEHQSKQRLQELMIRRALDDPKYLFENASYAAHIKEEVARTQAALIFPSRVLHAYLDDAGGHGGDDVAEEQESTGATNLPPELAADYERLNSEVRAMEGIVAPYTRRASEILIKLASIEAADRNSLPKLRVDREKALVVFGEIGYSEGEVVAAIFQALIDAQGVWISTRQMQANDAFLESVRVPRVIENLPLILHDLIDRKPGKGFRLKVELLA